MGHVDLKKWESVPVFRKIAMGSWRDSNQASIFAQVDLDMTKALRFTEIYAKEHDVKITPTHLVGRAFTRVLQARPEINGMIRGSRVYMRKHVDLFFSVNVPGQGKTAEDRVVKATLSGATVMKAETMSLADVARALQKKAETARSGNDPTFKATFRTLKFLPWWGARFFLNVISFLNYGLNLPLQWLGIPRDPFGSIIISNIGGMGVDVAFAPLMNYSRVPILVTVGAVKDRPVVIDGKLEVRPVLSLGVTMDHRFVDGVHAAHMNRELRACFDSPETYLA